jgi:aminodeoxyfutalosine deaminase
MASSNRYAELHLHLEGCIDEEILREIAPHLDSSLIADRLRFENFAGFLESFKFAVMQLREPDHFRLLARRAFARAAAQGVVYAEVIHSAGVCLKRGLDAQAIAEALIDEGRKAPLEIRWIFDAVRQFGEEHIYETARFTVGFAGTEVVGFGVGGDESGSPGTALKRGFQLAREHGLKLTPHAGETTNSQNVLEVVRLGADRIGHGIRAVEDPELVAELAQRQIPLEVSLTSNVMTGAVASYEAHPLRVLHEAGVPIILNTDDPGFFDTSMDLEFAHAERLGLSTAELEQIRLNGFRFAFCPTPLA